ncbi:hypothetical protein [Pontixanthobacter aquaemixtae]|uniref:Lipoprotein n=1 Tax=Pontixanthobacter aquaemixtae TaxID=1958940 RepID=A0A844ZUY5_9SPHN|nr:hypothetical protein [Pontixanthobacter aquaemixtae]MXO90587.1 hypothetical protein [Pontixanthobacter aquaemixtae]
MTTFTSILKATPVLAGAALLAACGSVADDDAAMKVFSDTCMKEFTEAGGPAAMAEGFCECSSKAVADQGLTAADMLDQEKMTAIGETCAKEMMAAEGAAAPAAETAPAE